MEIHRPSFGADHPGNRDAAAIRTELVTALPAAHSIDGAAPVELRTALAKSQQGTRAGAERKDASSLIEPKFLNGCAFSGSNRKRKRFGSDANSQVSNHIIPRAGKSAQPCRWRGRGGGYERTIRWH